MSVTSRILREYRAAARGRPTLVGCPHAGGSASFYAGWRSALPADWGLVALRYPGREDRFADAPATSIHELAQAAAVALAERPGPLVVFGHSMGASVAYETVLLLEAEGISPELLVVSAREPSHVLHRNGRWLPSDDDALADHLRSLSADMSSFLDEPELRELALPIVRADYRIVSEYGPTEPRRVRTPLLAVSGTADARVDRAGMAPWADLADRFDALEFEGDHFYLVGQERALVGEIARRLEAVWVA